MLDKLRSSDFVPLLHQTFHIHYGGEQPLETALSSVTDLSAPQPLTGEPPSDLRPPFALVLSGPQGAYLPQRIYQVEHETMGVLELFLVPIGPDKTGAMRYEAIFN